MKWKTPPLIKIYEALGAIADERLEVSKNSAKVYSSSWGKSYDVDFDPVSNAIMMNDNGSYWQGYLGYPGIAFLMLKGVLPFDEGFAAALVGIKWKDVNQKFKNDFDKTRDYVEEIMQERGVDLKSFTSFCDLVLKAIEAGEFKFLGKRRKPPTGY